MGKSFFNLGSVNFLKHFHEFREFEDRKYSLYTKKFKSILETTNKSKILDSLYNREKKSLSKLDKSMQIISLMTSDLRSMLMYVDKADSSNNDKVATNMNEVLKW